MESNFPKKTKKYKLNDRVICVSQKAPAMFMKLGKVMYYGYANNSKEKLVGVEFDKNVKVRDDVRKYFEARIGWGAFCNIKDLRKVTDENFDIESYKELVLQGLPEESTREIPKPKQQLSKKTPKGDNEITFEDEEEGDIEESTIQEEPEKVEEVPEKKPKKKEDKPKKKEDKGKKTKSKGTKTPKNKSETVTPKPPASPKKKPSEDETKLFEKKLEPKVTIEDNIIPVEPEPVPTPVLETTQQKTPFEIKSSEEFVKLEDENRNYYKKMQQLELQVTELILANNQLKTDYSEKSKEYEFLKENYKELKEGATDADTDLTQLREELSALKVQKEMFEEKSITLETELEKYKDYDSFKSKFEEMSVNYESIKIEREDLEKKLKDSEEHASVLKEELELIELEIDVAAREEDIPDNIDELKKNYAMIQSAFQKVDLDLEVQKEEYEEKIQSLNDEIASLKTSYKDVMSSDEVSNAMKKKDDEIKDLKELIDQYTNANKMVEQLSESCQTKEEEINRLNLELEKAVDNLKSYQEENGLLDDIIKEYEATIEESDVTRAELEGRIDNLKEEYQQLEEKLVKYKNKLEDVNQERDEFEMQSSTLETEKEQFDNFYQEYNKTVQDKQAKIKEKMTFMIHAKECYWDSLKWRLYFKAVPEAIKTDLHLEYFDKYKEMSNISDKIDIILENLILYYLFKESVKLDNLNLYNISNELVIYLTQYQGYLNLLKIRYLECKTQEEYKELSSHILYREVVRNYSKINEVYNQLRDNEFSTKISYSDIVESNIRLAEEIDESEFHEHKNLSFKFTITAIMGKLVQCYITEYTQKKTKDVIDKLMTKLIYANDLVFEMDIDDKDLEKMKSFLSDMPGNVVDFKLWFDLYYKEIDDHYLEQHQQLERLNDGIWAESISQIQEQLKSFEKLKEELNDMEAKNKELDSQIETKNAEIVKQNKIKINQDSKILKLQALANNTSTLELKISELKKVEKSQKEKIKELEQEREDLEVKMSKMETKKDTAKGSVLQMKHVYKNKLNKGNTFLNMYNKTDINEKYDPKTKFEINSLNAILSNLNGELIYYKSQYSYNKLEKLKKATPTFQMLNNNRTKQKFELPDVEEALKSLRSSEKMMKNEISKWEVIDLSDTKKAEKQIKSFYSSKMKVDHFYWNSIKEMEESIQNDNQILDIGYNVNYDKLLEESRDQQAGVYASLKILDKADRPRFKKNLKPVYLDVNIN